MNTRLLKSVTVAMQEADVPLGGRRMREPPSDNGPVRAGADQRAVIGAQLDAGDAAAVSRSHVGRYTLHVVPHLHQPVVTSCRQRERQTPDAAIEH